MPKRFKHILRYSFVCIGLLALCLLFAFYGSERDIREQEEPDAGLQGVRRAAILRGDFSSAKSSSDPFAPSTEDVLHEVSLSLRNSRKHCKLSVNIQTSWELIHAALAYGLNMQVSAGRSGGEISLNDYFFNERGQTKDSIYVGEAGSLRIRPTSYPGESESHPDQYLAVFAQLEVPLDASIVTDRMTYSVADLVQSAKLEYSSESASPFSLIAFSHYCDPAEPWINKYGREVSVGSVFSDVLRSCKDGEGPCGGTHGKFALAYALREHSESTEVLGSSVDDAVLYLNESLHSALRQQEANGSIPPAHIGMPRDDEVSRLYATGHVLEWVILVSDDRQLHDPKLNLAVAYLAIAVDDLSKEMINASAYCHAVHALRMYQRRMNESRDGGAAGQTLSERK